MLVCCGENVVDMIMNKQGSYQPIAGGSALNIAVGLGTMGNPTGYAMPISSDALGDMLMESLTKANVEYLATKRPDRLSGLAVVTLLDGGQPAYGFYRANAADTELEHGELPELELKVEHLHVGGSPSLGNSACSKLLMPWIHEQHGHRTLSIDPNVREALVDDRDSFLYHCDQIIEKATLCRLSIEDAQYMYNTKNPNIIADIVLDKGAKLVAVTLGDKGALLADDSTRVTSEFELPSKISDTVGAGDTFMAALLTWLRNNSLLDNHNVNALGENQLTEACTFACAAAAINCTRPGCSPPTLDEIKALLSKK